MKLNGPFSHARHRHRSGEDPRLGAGRRGSRLRWHRGRRPCLRCGPARRLEAHLQRARSLPRDLHHDGFPRGRHQEGRVVQRRADPAAAPDRRRRQAGGPGRYPERRAAAPGRRRGLEPCRIRGAGRRMEDPRRTAGRADRGDASPVDRGPGDLQGQVPHPDRRQHAAGAGAAPDPDLVRRLVGRCRQARRPHRRRLDADHDAGSGRAEARPAARASEILRARSCHLRARGLASHGPRPTRRCGPPPRRAGSDSAPGS